MTKLKYGFLIGEDNIEGNLVHEFCSRMIIFYRSNTIWKVELRTQLQRNYLYFDSTHWRDQELLPVLLGMSIDKLIEFSFAGSI